jgi:starch synthase
MIDRLKIIFVSSEMVPFAKTGGLADVSGTLPKAIKSLGHEIVGVIPFYKNISGEDTGIRMDIPFPDKNEYCSVAKGSLNGLVPIYFIRKDEYFLRDYLYSTSTGDYPDNMERFRLFSRAVIEMLKYIDFKPDIIHCNEWQTALIPVYLKTIYKNDPFLSNTTTIFTIHNLAYQGIFDKEKFYLTGLPEELFNINGLEFWGKINLLKGGILFSDLINTVSPKYCKELQTEEYGYGLDGVLRNRNKDLYGILNGVDYEEWNPETDRFIISNYSIKNLSGKRKCKEDLINEFKLIKDLDLPLIGMISRLADQKGFDILVPIIDRIIDLGALFVLLGTGEKRYHDLFKEIGKRYKGRVAIKIAFDNRLAHKIEAGSDMFLMPSKYEPCGLNQIYSMKYGTIPIVRGTGGLDDTVINFDPSSLEGNGFKFYEYSSDAFLKKIEEGIKLYRNKDLWLKIIKNAMNADFSWERSAREYINLYLMKR